MLSDADYNKVVATRQKFRDMPIYYVDTAGTVNEMLKTIISFSKRNPKRGILMTLDHTLLVNGSAGEQERIVLVNLVKELKRAVKHFKSLDRNGKLKVIFTGTLLKYEKVSQSPLRWLIN